MIDIEAGKRRVRSHDREKIGEDAAGRRKHVRTARQRREPGRMDVQPKAARD